MWEGALRGAVRGAQVVHKWYTSGAQVVYKWKAKDSVQESVLSFHPVGLRGLTSGAQACSQVTS